MYTKVTYRDADYKTITNFKSMWWHEISIYFDIIFRSILIGIVCPPSSMLLTSSKIYFLPMVTSLSCQIYYGFTQTTRYLLWINNNDCNICNKYKTIHNICLKVHKLFPSFKRKTWDCTGKKLLSIEYTITRSLLNSFADKWAHYTDDWIPLQAALHFTS